MNYPDRFIRGITETSVLRDRDRPLAIDNVGRAAFSFNTSQNRQDSKNELSVNWEDDDAAISFTLTQKKESGRIRYQVGVAIVPRLAIDEINSKPAIPNLLSYERAPLPNNNYHGNILVDEQQSIHTKRMLAALLAASVVEVHPNVPK